MNERTEENVMREPLHKTRALWKMAEGRFASVYSVEEFILEHENKNTAQKTERDVRLLERFLKTKDEDRKIEDIPAAELNEFISEFIISVRTKDGNEYEPTSLRSLMASFERHLKKKGYSASIINDLVFVNTGKLKCYELYALLLTCCWEIFKLLFTLFIAPFVLFVYQRQHEKISAPMK